MAGLQTMIFFCPVFMTGSILVKERKVGDLHILGNSKLMLSISANHFHWFDAWFTITVILGSDWLIPSKLEISDRN